MGWLRLLGGTRCGYYGYGTESQRPTGSVIRDKGEGKMDNPALASQQKSHLRSEADEQVLDWFLLICDAESSMTWLAFLS